MNNRDKEVYYNEYCKSCKYANTIEYKSPCNECLDTPSNTYSHRPVYYKPKEDKN